MKKLFSIIVILFTIVQLNAQTTLSGNGGQYAENGSLKLQFGGVVNSSQKKIWVKVWNKQGCKSDYRVVANSIERNLNNVWPFTYDTMHVVLGIDFKVKAKTTTNCGWTDFGWVELVVPVSALPVTIKSIKVTLSHNKIK